ncbi:MAG: thiamine diphosphokinase [Ruminococcaceae bacterium]|nr:thiamine diphosphokinase [Oscillospiraceae bacterium]
MTEPKMQPKRVYIFGAAGGVYPTSLLPAEIRKNDLYIAADGGFSAMQKMGVQPDIVLGDFDSMTNDVTPNADFGVAEVIRHPVEKDDTDTLLAIKLGFDRGYSDFALYGCLGGERFDHSVATIQSLAYIAERGGKAVAYGEPQEEGKTLVMTVLKNGALTFPPRPKGHFSVFAYGGECRGVTLKGFKYEAKCVTLSPSFPLGVSNSFLPGKEGSVEVEDGTLLILFYV